MLSPDLIQRRPYSTLLVVFACWKLILGLIAFTTPSPAYDTSTSLLLLQSNHDNASTFGVRFLKTICGSLTRWDAIFFAKIAEPGRGYWNEQEWAFGWGYTRVIAATRRGNRSRWWIWQLRADFLNQCSALFFPSISLRIRIPR